MSIVSEYFDQTKNTIPIYKTSLSYIPLFGAASSLVNQILYFNFI